MKHIRLFEEFKKGDIDPSADVRHRGTCVFPAEDDKVKDKKDHFPINNAKQARNALARAGQYDRSPSWFDGTLTELKEVIRKTVKEEFPSIEVSGLEEDKD